jgi:8-oxo-dGTP pyrophosphatase MutT (NUDIX family)
MSCLTHQTVATVIERQGLFLLVEERVEDFVYLNQPAGHLEDGESLQQAAIRETREEAGWEVELEAFLGVYQYTSSANGVCYVRHCFIAQAVREVINFSLEPAILGIHWMAYPQILERRTQLRSPAVLRVIDDYLAGKRYPLELITAL